MEKTYEAVRDGIKRACVLAELKPDDALCAGVYEKITETSALLSCGESDTVCAGKEPCERAYERDEVFSAAFKAALPAREGEYARVPRLI